MLVCSIQIISRLDSQSNFQMFTLYFGPHVDVNQHGVSHVSQNPRYSPSAKRFPRPCSDILHGYTDPCIHF